MVGENCPEMEFNPPTIKHERVRHDQLHES